MRAEGDAASRTLAWLEPRLDRVPEELARTVRDCVRQAAADPASGGGGESVPGLLSRCAAEELDRVVARPEARDVAVRLLAADASLTWAFEAAAELGEDVAALADAAGLRGRIGRRLAGAGRDDAPGGRGSAPAGGGSA